MFAYLSLLVSSISLATATQSSTTPSVLTPCKAKTYIISIDGGGVRGLIPAIIIADMEKQLGKSVTDIFDYFIGNSAGGILSLLLNVPNDPKQTNSKTKYTAAEIVESIKKMSFDIFGGIQKSSLDATQAKLSQIKNLFSTGSKYNPATLEKFTKDLFGSVRISQSVKPVFIATYNLNEEKILILSSTVAQTLGYLDFQMSDVARATSAAPFYFPVKVLELQSKNTNQKLPKLQLIDGGVGANNPLLLGLNEMLKYSTCKQNLTNTEYEIVSLGTGQTTSGFDKQDFSQTNPPILMLKPTIDGFMRAQSQSSDESVSAAINLLNLSTGKTNHYTRLQVDLKPEDKKLDAVKPDTQQTLEAAAKTIIASQKYKDLIERLKKDFSPSVDPEQKVNANPEAKWKSAKPSVNHN